MATLAEALEKNAPMEDIARAAVKEAAEPLSKEQKETLALELYKEATGRFPQSSSDRRAVYVWGFALVGFIFLLTIIMATVLVLNDASVPEWLGTLATALGSGIVGGLFGYTSQ